MRFELSLRYHTIIMDDLHIFEYYMNICYFGILYEYMLFWKDHVVPR